MLVSSPATKRSSSQAEQPLESPQKRVKRPYHHHHQLQSPVTAEPAITNNAAVDHLLTRSIGQSLRCEGFDLADPVALDGFRNATEEYVMAFTSYVRQSMLASRRVQPIPQDFEHALKRHRLSPDDLLPHLKSPSSVEPTPALLPSPPVEEDAFPTVSFLGPQLSGEDDRARSAHIPAHFPQFPSKHTYRSTPVYTQRESDPRRIRERATEDGRHGEEALRKLARAAFQDNQLAAAGREKKRWGGRVETMDGMFEKTVKALAKKSSRNTAVAGMAAPMEIESGAGADVEMRTSRSGVTLELELPPIVNCERDLWRRNGPSRAEGQQGPDNLPPERLEEKRRPNGIRESDIPQDNWVST